MKKDFLDELMEELQKLKEQSKSITISAPVAPHEVLKTVSKVIKNHEITASDLESMMALRDVTKADLDMLRDLKDTENT